MIFDHVGGIKDPLKQDPALKFCRNENKVISILTETHMNYDQIAKQNLFFLLKTRKNKHSSASEWWRNTKSSFKENSRNFSKNSTTHANI